MLTLLLKDSRLTFKNIQHFAGIYATMYGHSEIVDILIEDGRVDFTLDNSKAIISSYEEGHYDIFEKLWNLEYVNSYLKHYSPQFYQKISKLKMKELINEF